MSQLSRVVLGALLAPGICFAAPPVFHRDTCPVSLNGQRLGTDLTPVTGNSLRFSVAFEDETRLYHLWVLTSEADYPNAALTVSGLTHATSRDGHRFVSDGTLQYGVGSADYSEFGSTIDPPLVYVRAARDGATWKLLVWSSNDDSGAPYPGRWGQYNYNTSVNDLGTVASNRSVLHQGPLISDTPNTIGPGGNHVGPFGLVDGQLYLRVDTATGGLGRFHYTDAIAPEVTPWGGGFGEADLFSGTPYCWLLDPTCPTAGHTKAYVHNAGRTIALADGRLVTFYTFRDGNTGARLDKQIWYIESADNGVTWSTPSGTFADAGNFLLNGQPLAADGNFSTAEAAVGRNVCRSYFSTKDIGGNFVVATTSTNGACDTLFGHDFEGCD